MGRNYHLYNIDGELIKTERRKITYLRSYRKPVKIVGRSTRCPVSEISVITIR